MNSCCTKLEKFLVLVELAVIFDFHLKILTLKLSLLFAFWFSIDGSAQLQTYLVKSLLQGFSFTTKLIVDVGLDKNKNKFFTDGYEMLDSHSFYQPKPFLSLENRKSG